MNRKRTRMIILGILFAYPMLLVASLALGDSNMYIDDTGRAFSDIDGLLGPDFEQNANLTPGGDGLYDANDTQSADPFDPVLQNQLQ